jgi:Fe2+ transport system protein FeoA
VLQQLSTLADVRLGQTTVVVGVNGTGPFRRRLLDLGFVPGTTVCPELEGPFGDPVSYRLRDTVVALRRRDARRVTVTGDSAGLCRHSTRPRHPLSKAPVRAPRPAHGDPLVALAGNPNTGKSTVFNALTGLHQHVGNWPGKTVTRAIGSFTVDGRRYRLLDLPGSYSLEPLSPEEQVAAEVLELDPPDCTVVVADAARLERNLNLLLQVLERTAEVVICLNLIDEAEAFGIVVDHRALQQRLGVPVVPTVARAGVGLRRLRRAIARTVDGERDAGSCRAG